ncbi:MAG: MATE family efflux transporter [Acidobacteriota bacterium]
MPEPTISPQPPAGAVRRSWRFLRQALAGTEEDFTQGSLGRAIGLLAIPMVLEMSMESIFAVVDVFFVARLGADAVATVGLTESVLTLVFAIAIGLSMATTAVVARRIGEKNREQASVTAVQAILLGLAVSAAIGVTGVWAAPKILALMGATPEVIAVGTPYTTLMTGGSVTIVLLFLNNAIFRGAGDASVAMRSLWLANGINIVLDPCLIFGLGPFPELGLLGAAVATNTGRGIGVLYQFYCMFKGHGRITIAGRHLRFNPSVTLRLLKVSAGGIMQFLIATSSWIGLVRILAIFGSSALAGYTIAIRIAIFALLPSWGMGNAAATLVGQNLGAGKADRAERSVWLTSWYNMAFLGMVGIVFIFFAEAVVGIFTHDPAVLPIAADCLRVMAYGYAFYAIGMVIVQAFNGAGDTNTPTVINFFCYWLLQIPLAYGLAQMAGLEERGVFLAILVAEIVLTVTGVLVFRRGRWKNRQV